MGYIQVKKRRPYPGINHLGIGLLALVCGAGIFWAAVRVIRDTAQGTKRLELYYKGARRFGEDQKKLLLKGIAGFWTYDLEKMAGGRLIIKKDRLEIKENGIVWQVVEWKMSMPDSSSAVFTQIRTAFINPYGISRGDTLSDVYVLSQAFIGRADTCFGGYNYSELWQTARRGEDLMASRRNYRPYRGELSVFFPTGAVDLVEASEKQLYYDTVVDGIKETKLNSVRHIRKTDAGTGRVSLIPIRDSINGLDRFFRLHLEERWQGINTGRGYGENDAAVLLDRYYQPFVVDERWRLFPRKLPGKVEVCFVVRTDGTVDSVRIHSQDAISRMFTSDMTEQVVSWRLPPSHRPVQVTHTFTMPR